MHASKQLSDEGRNCETQQLNFVVELKSQILTYENIYTRTLKEAWYIS